MQVLSVRCGVTKNLGNYESAKLEIEAAPSDGQTADSLLAEVGKYLENQIASSNGNGKGKPVKTEAPLKNPAPEPCSEPAPTKEPKRGRPAKKTTDPAVANVNKPNHAKELQYTLESQTMGELFDRFNTLSKLSAEFGEGWKDVITTAHDKYKELNSLDTDEKLAEMMMAALKREKNLFVEAQSAAT